MENNNQGRINDYDYIIKETNIVDIISHYVKVVKKGSSYFAICPFHNDTSPSLSIQPDKKIWTC
jgi:DNA primase